MSDFRTDVKLVGITPSSISDIPANCQILPPTKLANKPEPIISEEYKKSLPPATKSQKYPPVRSKREG